MKNREVHVIWRYVRTGPVVTCLTSVGHGSGRFGKFYTDDEDVPYEMRHVHDENDVG